LHLPSDRQLTPPSNITDSVACPRLGAWHNRCQHKTRHEQESSSSAAKRWSHQPVAMSIPNPSRACKPIEDEIGEIWALTVIPGLRVQPFCPPAKRKASVAPVAES
jgi:hypothetical protein